MRIVGIDFEHALPATLEADHLPAVVVGVERDRTNAGVEPGHIAAAGQNSDLHVTPANDDEQDWLAALGPPEQPCLALAIPKRSGAIAPGRLIHER